MSRIGSGFIGTDTIKKTTMPNQDIVPTPPSHWTTKYSLYRLSFMNYQDCRIRINGGEPIFIQTHQGFDTSEVDQLITSFVIVEEGIDYRFVAGY